MFEQNGMLTMEVEIEYSNKRRKSETIRIPVGETFDLSLGGIDMDKLPLTPEECSNAADKGKLPEGFAAPLLNEGEKLEQMGAYSDRLILMVQKADGGSYIRVCEWTGDCYETQDSVRLFDGAGLDTVHAASDEMFLTSGASTEVFFRRTEQNRWLMDGGMDPDLENGVYFTMGSYYVVTDNDQTALGSNDDLSYGWATPVDLMQTPSEEWPMTWKQAVARLDTDAYAFVNNDNPADRLHLREKPDRNAKSLGKFYNRTPVQILSWDGDWAHVRIGVGGANLEGYMMTRYLVRGGGNRDVRCAFEVLMPLEELEDGAPIYRGPDDAAEEIGRFGQNDGEYVIGVYGGDWVIVMTWDGNVGYVRRADLWEGNG